jgi:hypothetical protein
VTVPDRSSLDLSGSFTLEAWVKFDSLPGNEVQTIIYKGRSSSSLSYALFYLNGFTVALRGTNGTHYYLQDDSTPALGQWHHVAATYNRSQLRLFVNGQLTASRSLNVSISTSSRPVTLGYNELWTDGELDGTLDEVRISSTARYSGSFTPLLRFSSDSNTRALWHLDEGTGQTSADATRNNNRATLGTSTAVESSDPAWRPR